MQSMLEFLDAYKHNYASLASIIENCKKSFIGEDFDAKHDYTLELQFSSYGIVCRGLNGYHNPYNYFKELSEGFNYELRDYCIDEGDAYTIKTLEARFLIFQECIVGILFKNIDRELGRAGIVEAGIYMNKEFLKQHCSKLMKHHDRRYMQWTEIH